MVFLAHIIASARTPESRRTPSELYEAKGILKSSPGKRRSPSAALGDRQSQTDTGGPELVLMVLPSFGDARESRNLLPRCARGWRPFRWGRRNWDQNAFRRIGGQPLNNNSGLAAIQIPGECLIRPSASSARGSCAIACANANRPSRQAAICKSSPADCQW